MILLSKRLRLGALILVLILAAVGGYGWWWETLAHRVEDGLTQWVARYNTAGGRAETGAVTVSGFPFRLRLSVAAPLVAAADGTAWRSPPLSVELSPLAPGHLLVAAPGHHEITVAGATLAIDVGAASADIDADAQGVKDVSLRLDSVSGSGLRADGFVLDAERLAVGAVPADRPSVAIQARVDSLTLPETLVAPFPPGPLAADLSARVLGSLPATATMTALGSWRDQGGVVEFDAVSLHWPPLDLAGKATLALDGDMQPEFAGTATLRGLIDALERLEAAGLAHPQETRIAKVALGLLARKNSAGVLEWTVPLSIQNRTLFAGPVPVAHLPRLVW